METHVRTARPAFTLIELLAVVAVTGILAVVALPAVSQLAATQRRAAANVLQRDLTYARERASSTGVKAWVVFSSSSQSYSVLSENAASPGRAGATTLTDPATQTAFVKKFGQGDYTSISLGTISFDSDNEVGFDRLGQPLRTSGALRTSDGTVILSNAWRVRVAARTGLVTVEAAP